MLFWQRLRYGFTPRRWKRYRPDLKDTTEPEKARTDLPHTIQAMRISLDGTHGFQAINNASHNTATSREQEQTLPWARYDHHLRETNDSNRPSNQSHVLPMLTFDPRLSLADTYEHHDVHKGNAPPRETFDSVAEVDTTTDAPYLTGAVHYKSFVGYLDTDGDEVDDCVICRYVDPQHVHEHTEKPPHPRSPVDLGPPRMRGLPPVIPQSFVQARPPQKRSPPSMACSKHNPNNLARNVKPRLDTPNQTSTSMLLSNAEKIAYGVHEDVGMEAETLFTGLDSTLDEVDLGKEEGVNESNGDMERADYEGNQHRSIAEEASDDEQKEEDEEDDNDEEDEEEDDEASEDNGVYPKEADQDIVHPTLESEDGAGISQAGHKNATTTSRRRDSTMTALDVLIYAERAGAMVTDAEKQKWKDMQPPLPSPATTPTKKKRTAVEQLDAIIDQDNPVDHHSFEARIRRDTDTAELLEELSHARDPLSPTKTTRYRRGAARRACSLCQDEKLVTPALFDNNAPCLHKLPSRPNKRSNYKIQPSSDALSEEGFAGIFKTQPRNLFEGKVAPKPRVETWCYCGAPYTGQAMYRCCNEECFIGWYHDACLRATSRDGKLSWRKTRWLCDLCGLSTISQRGEAFRPSLSFSREEIADAFDINSGRNDETVKLGDVYLLTQ